MFAKLDQEKVMFFKDEQSSLTFANALKNLAREIGQPGLSAEELENIILKALTDAASALNSKQDLTVNDNKTLIVFHQWVQSIHNDNLAPPQGARFPNNIVFDLISALRTAARENTLTAEQTLLRFFMEGANGRKICKGKTPGSDFIATGLLVDAIGALNALGVELPESTEKFYTPCVAYSLAQRSLEAGCASLGNDELFGLFVDYSKGIMNFKREINEQTDAHRYFLDQAIQEGMSIVSQNVTDAQVKAMIEKIESVYVGIVSAFQQARNNSTSEDAYFLAKWDASEWLSRIYVALTIASNFDSKYQPHLDAFMKHDFCSEIISESLTGNFPGKKLRDGIWLQIQIVELFTQAKLASFPQQKAPLSMMFEAKKPGSQEELNALSAGLIQ